MFDRVAISLELGDLTHRSGERLWERVGKAGLKKNGEEVWRKEVMEAVGILREAMAADYVLLGGGNAARLGEGLPGWIRCGGNDDAYEGGMRLWEEMVEPHDREPARVWRVV